MGAAAWWFIAADGGPRVSFYQLVYVQFGISGGGGDACSFHIATVEKWQVTNFRRWFQTCKR